MEKQKKREREVRLAKIMLGFVRVLAKNTFEINLHN